MGTCQSVKRRQPNTNNNSLQSVHSFQEQNQQQLLVHQSQQSDLQPYREENCIKNKSNSLQLEVDQNQFKNIPNQIEQSELIKKNIIKTSDEPELSQVQDNMNQESSYQTNNYTHFLQSHIKFDLQKKHEVETVTIQTNGTLQTKRKLIDETEQFVQKQSQCFYCKKSFTFEIYIVPCKHQFHLQCLLETISEQIKQKQYKIKCICQKRIHINFLRQINFENKLNLITKILNNQVEQLIEEYSNSFKDAEEIKKLFNLYQSTQDYYYASTNDQSQLLLTNQTPGES